MKIITVDFESFYSQTFSLSKMTSEEYVRSPEFEVIGVAVQVNDGEPQWCSGTKEKIKGFLEGFALDKNLVVAHNAVFDMAILNWIFGIRPEGIIDTLSMARAVHGTEVGGSLKALAEHYAIGVKGTEVLQALGKRRIDFTTEELDKYGEYCKNDVSLTYKLFTYLAVGFPSSELRLIDITIRMFTEPVFEINSDLLQEHLEVLRKNKEELMARITANREQIMSNDKFAGLLKGFGVEPPMKISLATGRDTWAFAKTDEGFKALAEHENPMVQALVAARLGVKSTLEETRTERFIDIAGRGAFPIPLKYYAAKTGRWAGMDSINVQNLPRGSLLKSAIRAPSGYLVVEADSSQIECRVLAWLAEQNDLVDAFERGEDVYKSMASSIYGKEVKDIAPAERQLGKVTILSSGYGVGAARFQATLKNASPPIDLPEDECKRIIDTYRSTYEWIPILWRQGNTVLEAIISDQTAAFGKAGVLTVEGSKGIRMPNGMYIAYPNLRSQQNAEGKFEFVYDLKRGKSSVETRIYGGKVVENVAQGLARIIIGEQMIQVAKKYKVALTVHDSIVAVVPEAEKEQAVEYIEMCMRMRPKWGMDLPLNCESGVGESYGEC